MYKWIPFTRRLLRMLYQFCFVILIYAIIYSMFKAPFPDFKWFIYLFLAMAASYTFRETCSKGLYLLLIHIAMIVPIWFMSDDLYLKILVSVTIFIFFSDGQRYISKGYVLKRMFDVPWESFVAGLAAILLGLHMKDHTLTVLGYLIPVAAIFLYIIAVYLEGLEDYLNTTKYVTGAPMKQIVSVNTVIISGIICIAIALLILSDVLNLKTIVTDFFKTCIAIFRIIFTVFYMLISILLTFLTGGAVVNKTDFRKVKSIAEDAGLLTNIIQTLFFVAFAAFIIYLIVRVVRWFIRIIMAKHLSELDTVEEISSKDRGIKKEKIPREKGTIFKDSVHKARYIYKKKVLSYKEHFIPEKVNTTGDIDKMVKNVSTEPESGDEGLRELYEAVRYGDVIPDSKYLKKMKNTKYP